MTSSVFNTISLRLTLTWVGFALMGSQCLAEEPLAASASNEPVPLADFPARLVAVWPPDGATEIPPNTSLRLRFDRPIDPRTFSLKWDRGGFLEAGDPTYNAELHELVVPVSLVPGHTHEISVGADVIRRVRDSIGLEVSPRSWAFTTSAGESEPERLKAVALSIDPPSGSTVSRVALVTVKFNRPVDYRTIRVATTKTRQPDNKRSRLPLDVEAALPLEVRGSGREVTMPVVFPRGWEGEVQFLFGDAEPITVSYATSEKLIDWDHPKLVRGPESKAATRAVVEKARAARSNLQSADVLSKERLLSSAGRNTVRPFSRLQVVQGEFRFQGDKQFFADVSGWMNDPFVIGSDGEKCWFFRLRRSMDEPARFELIRCDYNAIDEKQVTILDAFGFKTLVLDGVLEGKRLSVVGSRMLDGDRCDVIRSWEVQPILGGDRVWLHITDWWIDSTTYLPRRVVRFFGGGSKQVIDLKYHGTNKSMQNAAFEAPGGEAVTHHDVEPLGDGYSNRFLRISDGSDGRVSGRWGKSGEVGMSSSGLN